MILRQQKVVRIIILIPFLLLATKTIHADINYECVIMLIKDNNEITYNRLEKTQPAPFAKTTITKRKNLIYDGTFYYEYNNSKNATDFYYNKPFKMIVTMSSKPVNRLNGSDLYSLVILRDTAEMAFICKEN